MCLFLNICNSETSKTWVLGALTQKALAVHRADRTAGTFPPWYIDMY